MPLPTTTSVKPIASPITCSACPHRRATPVSSRRRTPLVQRRTAGTTNTGKWTRRRRSCTTCSQRRGSRSMRQRARYFRAQSGHDFSRVQLTPTRARRIPQREASTRLPTRSAITSSLAPGIPLAPIGSGEPPVAHELSHVVQQSGVDTSTRPGMPGFLQRSPMDPPLRTDLANERMRRRTRSARVSSRGPCHGAQADWVRLAD